MVTVVVMAADSAVMQSVAVASMAAVVVDSTAVVVVVDSTAVVVAADSMAVAAVTAVVDTGNCFL